MEPETKQTLKSAAVLFLAMAAMYGLGFGNGAGFIEQGRDPGDCSLITGENVTFNAYLHSIHDESEAATLGNLKQAGWGNITSEVIPTTGHWEPSHKVTATCP